MGTQEFTVLYTHQKLKKAKVWQDGTLKIGHLGNKAILYDDKGQCLESIFLKCLEVKPGDDLEGDRYLITVEETKVAGSKSAATTVVKGEANPKGCMSFGWSHGCQPVGLKRKFTGFQGPREVPPKILVTESGGLATSLEAKKAGPLSLSPFYGTSPLFSTAGHKDVRNISADPGSTVAFEDRERNGLPFSSSVVSTPAFKIHPETIGQQNYFCLPISSENEHLHSLLTDEPVKRDGLSPHQSGVSQNIRSKAQILALLKSKPPGLCRELSSECREHGPQEQSHNSVTILPEPTCLAEQEECSEGQLESLWSQQSLGNGTRKRSRWTRYLPSQRSPELAETEEGNNITESGGKSKEDSSVSDNHNQLWDQEVTLETPAFSENNGLTVTCQVENDTLLLESDISENSKICIHPNRAMCQEESHLMRENAEEGNICGIVEVASEPGPESEEPQREPSSFSNNSRVSDDITGMFFKNSTDYKGFDGCPEFRSGGEQPLVEVTFNLCGFEGSDIEEESQTSHKRSPDSEGWVKEALATCGHPGDQRPCEEVRGEEVGSDPLPLLMSDRGKPTESLSQFCDKTRAGFYPGTWRTENTGTVVGQESSGDTLSKYDSSFEWLDDDQVEIDEEASQLKVSLNNDFASFPNAYKNTEKNVQMPHFSNTKTSLFSEECPPFILGNNVKDEQVLLPPASSSEDRVQLPDANPSHSEERIAFGELDTQLPSSSLYLQGTRHPILKDTEVRTPESENLGRIRTLPHNLMAVEAAGGKLHSNRPKNSSELSGSISNISLLKSLSAHSTALEGLELMRREKSAFKQQQSLQAYGPESRPEAGRSLVPIVSQAVPEFPHLNQDSPKMQKENEVGPTEPLESPEFFAFGNEEKPVFGAVNPKQIDSTAYDPQPVEFQGHQVKGSAAGTMMVRKISTLWECSLSQESVQSENCAVNAWFLTTQEPSTSVQTDFLQFPNGECLPTGSTSFNIEDSYQAITESEKDSFENDLMTKSNFLENKHLEGLPLTSTNHAPSAAYSNPISWVSQEALGPRLLSTCAESAPGASSFGPELPRKKCFSPAPRGMTARAVSVLNQDAAQSKWLKYQTIPQANSVESDVTAAASGMDVSCTGTRMLDSAHGSWIDTLCLQRIQGTLHDQQQEVSGSELCFPSRQKTKCACLPQRQTHIPAIFHSPAQYKQVFTACLLEHLNIMLFGLAQRLHRALAKVDISFYTSSKGEDLKNAGKSVPSCYHHQPAKLVIVKKDGPNKGRLFYACDGPKSEQCKFFMWFEAATPGHVKPGETQPVKVLNDTKSIGLYLRSQRMPLYEECQLVLRKGFDLQRKQYDKLKKFGSVNSEFYNEPKSKLYLKLSRKEISSTYSKDDLWVVSKTLDFELDTFIACSAFFGPSSINEVELVPLKGYFPSNWPTSTVVHALLVCNASTELTTLKNIQDHFNPATLPLMPSLLTFPSSTVAVSDCRVNRRRFVPPAFSNTRPQAQQLSLRASLQLAQELVEAYRLNQDQAAALTQIARMIAAHPSVEGTVPEEPVHPITIIHGVFGAGKSYLLALVVLFFVQLFEKSEAATEGNARPWKLLISSSTNVAVDRVLLGLLSLGFEKFVRVGSIRKIAKQILPYSLHTGSENESEQLKELQALMREDLTLAERMYVRRSIEQHKLGTNRTLLRQVRVVGVTCAACPFPCMNDLKFPVVVLDECSQITEPASLLPIARFECEKLILVGDPKQLPPTIQGSDASHGNGLEQTLFDRLCLMGHKPVLLRTQYRCHPAISAIANDLFYEGCLVDGISDTQRGPLLAWLPTLCFFNVRGLEQSERDNSFHNVAEAAFTLKLIQSLIASGISGSVIGVITLYKSQMYKLCQAFSTSHFEHPELRAVQVSTVDAFQGAEKEVIILSCVRTHRLGFIDSERRMNVALTRGRRHLLIVGNLACLRKNQLWGRVIQHCEGREGGIQHASQFELQLDRVLEDYLQEQAAAKQKKKKEKETER